jgi:glycosyltransferase involved in cell wall biosynthesis
MTSSIFAPLHIHILSPIHGIGLRRTTAILAAILHESGFKVTVTLFRGNFTSRMDRAIRKLGGSVLRRPLYDVNIFVESAQPSWFRLARINCLIPNQEWVREGTMAVLSEFDWILCKTKHAEGIFGRLGYRARYIGFTSFDRIDDKVSHDYDSFIHIAGNSMLKGTEILLQSWLNHPEWPHLKILWHAEGITPTPAANIQWMTASVGEEMLRRLQNSHSVHFCLSVAEGFGHYIVEAMSCQALVFATDAPPMNEIVRPERGILVPHVREWAMRLGTSYQVDEAAIERAVDGLGQMNMTERRQMGKNARLWYLENDQLFRQRLVAAIRECAV